MPWYEAELERTVTQRTTVPVYAVTRVDAERLIQEAIDHHLELGFPHWQTHSAPRPAHIIKVEAEG